MNAPQPMDQALAMRQDSSDRPDAAEPAHVARLREIPYNYTSFTTC